jgi:hypothetical protein
MIARLRSHRLTITALIELIKVISKKLKSDKDKTVLSLTCGYLSVRMLDGPQSQPGRGGAEKCLRTCQ